MTKGLSVRRAANEEVPGAVACCEEAVACCEPVGRQLADIEVTGQKLGVMVDAGVEVGDRG